MLSLCLKVSVGFNPNVDYSTTLPLYNCITISLYHYPTLLSLQARLSGLLAGLVGFGFGGWRAEDLHLFHVEARGARGQALRR